MSFCPNCGTQLDDSAVFCPNCGQRCKLDEPAASPSPGAQQTTPTTQQPTSSAQQTASRGQCPDSYLLFAILTTLFCCLPFGIVAIVKAASVSSKYQSGDYEGAVQASNDAKKMVQDCRHLLSYPSRIDSCRIRHHGNCRCDVLVLKQSSWQQLQYCCQDCFYISTPQPIRNPAACFPNAFSCS